MTDAPRFAGRSIPAWRHDGAPVSGASLVSPANVPRVFACVSSDDRPRGIRRTIVVALDAVARAFHPGTGSRHRPRPVPVRRLHGSDAANRARVARDLASCWSRACRASPCRKISSRPKSRSSIVICLTIRPPGPIDRQGEGPRVLIRRQRNGHEGSLARAVARNRRALPRAPRRRRASRPRRARTRRRRDAARRIQPNRRRCRQRRPRAQRCPRSHGDGVRAESTATLPRALSGTAAGSRVGILLSCAAPICCRRPHTRRRQRRPAAR